MAHILKTAGASFTASSCADSQELRLNPDLDDPFIWASLYAGHRRACPLPDEYHPGVHEIRQLLRDRHPIEAVWADEGKNGT